MITLKESYIFKIIQCYLFIHCFQSLDFKLYKILGIVINLNKCLRFILFIYFSLQLF